MAKTSGGKPPPSTDLEGWCQAIAGGCLTTFRLEHIAAAFQDLGPADRRVYDALTRHLSGAISRALNIIYKSPFATDGTYRSFQDIMAARNTSVPEGGSDGKGPNRCRDWGR
jgi:hypothetical protein